MQRREATMHQLVTAGGVLLIGLAVVVAIVVAVNLPHSWAGLLYVVALFVMGIAGIRAGGKLRRKSEAAVRTDAF
jgi:hypothetical protein